MFAGMAIANTLVEDIDESYLVFAVTITPPLFMGVSIPVMINGGLLFKIKKKRPKKEYF